MNAFHRDPKTGRFMPSQQLSGRAADMLASFNEGRAFEKRFGYRWWQFVTAGVGVGVALHAVIRAVWP